jgi:hypothetical protein
LSGVEIFGEQNYPSLHEKDAQDKSANAASRARIYQTRKTLQHRMKCPA